MILSLEKELFQKIILMTHFLIDSINESYFIL
jgi:hypothetical protein